MCLKKFGHKLETLSNLNETALVCADMEELYPCKLRKVLKGLQRGSGKEAKKAAWKRFVRLRKGARLKVKVAAWYADDHERVIPQPAQDASA